MRYFSLIIVLFIVSCTSKQKPAIVFQTDFGVKDGAVSAMKGVAYGVDASLPMYDLTHEIPAYNIWEAAYRLNQSAVYWPAGTVFVSVVDPGVGTSRKPVVLKTGSGHYVVSPDNGTLTLIAESLGIESVREIDTARNRRVGSEGSHTFHGRDIFAYTAARLASGAISFEEVGPELKKDVVRIDYQHAVLSGDSLRGNIPVLDIQYGNVWTNIADSVVSRAGIKYGDSLSFNILNNGRLVAAGRAPFVRTFGDVADKQVLGYLNSLGNFSLALNMGSFADSFKIASGAEWTVILSRGKF
ncbi:MAG TPA: S-adenosyl-l-methionine hydroxide adenosyltransferase family protein [Chitinophagaceae bacterium]|nr:S-adenosyl-l-methionine hydroxide adenosyltransferase family protein [Chitinophagaceae bacterium]